MTEFGELQPDGRLTNVRTIPQSALLACPHFILMPEHYRGNDTCRCDDPLHAEMADWGYNWDSNTERWIAPETEANG